jgi:hypothetical protein
MAFAEIGCLMFKYLTLRANYATLLLRSHFSPFRRLQLEEAFLTPKLKPIIAANFQEAISGASEITIKGDVSDSNSQS